MSAKQTIAAFDFDGTITTKDTMFAFLRFVKGEGSFWVGMLVLSPMFALYALKFYTNQQAKEKMLTYFLKGMSTQTLYEYGKQFNKTILPQLIRPQAKERVAWHQSQGHICYLVSASLDFWLKDWAEEYHFQLVCSKPLVENGIFTGKIEGKNCFKAEKVTRLLQELTPQTEYEFYGYGDSSGDEDLLAWVDYPLYKPFRQ